MSISSFENFSEQLQKLPLQNPPKGLLLDVQSTVQRRKAFKQKAMQCSVVLSLFVATLWIVVDQQSSSQPDSNVAENEVIEESEFSENEVVEENEFAENENELPFANQLASLNQPSILTPTAIVMRITDINKEVERLPQSATARRQELDRIRFTLMDNYRSIRLQQQARPFQKVAYFN